MTRQQDAHSRAWGPAVRSWLLALCAVASVQPVAAAGSTACTTQLRPNSQYETASADGQEVLDKNTGLVWARCAVGQQWKGGTCQASATFMTWHAAMALAAQPDKPAAAAAWRLPNHRELMSLVDRGCLGPAINAHWFPETVAASYWSSTPSPEDVEGKAWGVDFFDGGYKGLSSKSQARYVRLVRTVAGAAPRTAPADFVPVLVYSSSGRFDNSFSEAAWKGAERFRIELKPSYREVQIDDAQQAEKVFARIADSGVSMIVAVGFTYQQVVEKVAPRYPSTKFVLIDAQVAGGNVQSVLFGQHEGSFLVGMVGALTSKTGKLGFIGGMDVPVVRAFGCGYQQGARYANRNVQIISDTVSAGPQGFNDPDRGSALAASQFNRGADVVFAAAGRTGLGVLRVAKSTGPWAIGVDVNQNWVAPGAVLTSMVKRIDNAVYESLRAGYTGQWQAGTKTMGLKEGGVEWALDSYNRKLIGPEVAARVERARRDIVEGKLSVMDSTATGTCPGV